jgi:hypothetical protein
MIELFVIDTDQKETLRVDINELKRWPQVGEIITIGRRVLYVHNFNSIFPDDGRKPYVQVLVTTKPIM